jgi:hypothetical protein
MFPNPNLVERQAQEYRAERLKEAQIERLTRGQAPAGAPRRWLAYAVATLLVTGGFFWGLW